MNRFVDFFYFITVACVLNFGTPAVASSPPLKVTIVIENMKFTPAQFEARKGEAIVWENKDLVPHTVTASDKGFDSKTIQPGKSWLFLPKKAGTYSYKCTFHPTMLGSLIIK